MLSYLRIRGLALLDDVTLDLSRGMNVLTGETGAGKSIIVEALALARGARAKGTTMRSGADAISVDAQFELDGPIAQRVRSVLEAHGLPDDDPGSLIVQRSVPRTGRGRCFLQAELTTQTVLSQVGEVLIDICSQHEHHSLTQVGRHLELLDGYAGLDVPLAEYAGHYRAYRSACAELQQLESQSAEAAARADYLRFQLEELERIAPEPGEYEQLQGRLDLLRNAQRWAQFAREAHDLLYESEDSVVTHLTHLTERARRGAARSDRLAMIVDQLGTAAAACEEADREALRLANELELEPAQLEEAEARLSELSALRRKYGATLDDAPERLRAMRTELDALDHAEERLAEVGARAQQLRALASQHALALRTRRQAGRQGLARAVIEELRALHIPRAQFEAALEPLADDQLGPRGLDRVEFLFSANPGEPPAALSRVASGGELSRVLLAVKGVLSTGDQVATYVFDEVDAGVGGAVAQAIGQRLSRAAQDHQVLCITHLPQIAAFADTHYRVEKRTAAGRTTTRVVPLRDEQRVDELARMLGGARVTDAARAHAAQLLEEAKRTRKHKPGRAPAEKRRPSRKRKAARTR